MLQTKPSTKATFTHPQQAQTLPAKHSVKNNELHYFLHIFARISSCTNGTNHTRIYSVPTHTHEFITLIKWTVTSSASQPQSAQFSPSGHGVFKLNVCIDCREILMMFYDILVTVSCCRLFLVDRVCRLFVHDDLKKASTAQFPKLKIKWMKTHL